MHFKSTLFVGTLLALQCSGIVVDRFCALLNGYRREMGKSRVFQPDTKCSTLVVAAYLAKPRGPSIRQLLDSAGYRDVSKLSYAPRKVSENFEDAKSVWNDQLRDEEYDTFCYAELNDESMGLFMKLVLTMLHSTTSLAILHSAGCLLGLSGLLASAFGSHGLPPKLKLQIPDWESKPLLLLERQRSWDAGTRQQQIHALAILYCAYARKPIAGYLFLLGTLGFCGTVYLINLNPAYRAKLRRVAPNSGYVMMAGWISLLLGF